MQKNRVTLKELATVVTGGNLRAAARLLNDAGMTLDENEPDGDALVPRDAVVATYAKADSIRIATRLGILLQVKGD